MPSQPYCFLYLSPDKTPPPTPKPTTGEGPPPGEPTTDPTINTPLPTLEPTQECIPCPFPELECGYGIWNVCTCQCDCGLGFCLSINQECYDSCSTGVNDSTNPWAGCVGGRDCPWFPSPSGKEYCMSRVNMAGQYNLHRTAEQCCERHFSYRNINKCVAQSRKSVEKDKEDATRIEERPLFYYPDLWGRDNCIFNQYYYVWMEGTVSKLLPWSAYVFS